MCQVKYCYAFCEAFHFFIGIYLANQNVYIYNQRGAVLLLLFFFYR